MFRKTALLTLAFSFLFGIQSVNGAEQPAWTGDNPESKTLQITAARPTGEVRNPVEITVKFNQPMVALGDVSARKEGLEKWVRITPELKGDFHWLGSDTLVWRPEERFPFSTSYNVKIMEGFASVSGKTLSEDYSFSFNTPAIRVKSVNPEDKDTGVDINKQILLRFDQGFDLELLREKFNLLHEDGSNIPLKIERRSIYSSGIAEEMIESMVKGELEKLLSREEKTSALITPVEPLERSTKYCGAIAADFHGEEGPLTLQKGKYEFCFKTYDPLAILGDGSDNKCRHGIEIKFNNAVQPEEFDKYITVTPQVPFDEGGFNWYSKVNFSGALLEPEETYEVTINKGLKDEHGNELGEDFTYKVTTDALYPQVEFNQSFAGLEATGPLLVPMVLRSIGGFDLKVERFNDPMHLVTKKIVLPDKDTKRDRINLPEKPKRSIMYGLDLSPYMNPDQPYGIFRLTAEEKGLKYCGWNKTDDMEDKTVIQVTDMALTSKVAQEKSLVWITGLSNGKPLPSVKVELFFSDGDVLGEAVTDQDGVAQFPFGMSHLNQRKKEKNKNAWDLDLVFVATNGNDKTFIRHGRYGVDSAWSFGVQGGSGKTARLKGFIFTDRAVYRPGEDLYFKGWLRTRTQEGVFNFTGRRLSVTVLDRAGQKIHEGDYDLSRFGGFDGKVNIPENIPLGPCRIEARLTDRKDVFRGSFDVREYRVPEFEVNVKTGQDAYVVGDTVKADVQGKYLFGGTMKNAQVAWSLRMTPSYFSPPGHRGYVFSNWAEMWMEDEEGRHLSMHELLAEGEGTISSEGTFEVTQKLGPAKGYSDYSVTLEATVTDVNRQQISGRSWSMVHAAEFSIGLKTSDQLIEAGKKLQVNLVAADRKGKVVPGVKAEVVLLKREWHTVRREGVGGWWEYESKPEDTVIETREINLKDGRTDVSFVIPSSGEYHVGARSRDARGNVSACSTRVWSWGAGYVPWRMDNDNTVEMVPDKEKYEPGDTAKILIKNPLGSCNALLSLEREGFIEKRLVRLEGSAPVIEVPILTEHIPNVFVSVVLVKGRISEDLDEEGKDVGRPTYKAGYVNLPISIESKRLHVGINAPAQAQPGQTVEVSIFVTDGGVRPRQADVTLMAVDVGVLNLTGYKTPDPLSAFWNEEGLGVTMKASLDSLLSRINFGMKGKEPGGGGKGMAALARLRGKFLTTPLFLPSVITDENGQGKISFKLPDNLTRYRIMAVAADHKELFGSAEKDLTVKLPLMLQPSLPRFANVGDSFRSGVVVHNQSGSDQEVTVSIKSNGLLVTGPGSVTVKIPNGMGKEVLFDMEAKVPGTATLQFTASSGELGDRSSYSFPVKTPLSKEVVAAYGVITEKGLEKVRAPKNVFKEIGGLDLTVGSTALSGLEEAIGSLINYPYGCLEQQLSRLVPIVTLRDVIKSFGIESDMVDMDKMEKSVREYTDEIPLYQVRSGAMSYWKESRYGSPYLSAYSLEYILSAAALGDRSAQELLQKGFTQKLISYLRELLEKNRQPKKQWTGSETRDGFYNISTSLEAYICWILARADRADISHQNRLWEIYREEPGKLSITGRLFLLGAAAQSGAPEFMADALGEDLDRLIVETASGAYLEDILSETDYDWYYLSSRTTHTALALDILSRYRPDSVSIPKMARYLIRSRINGKWRTTHEGGRALLALVTYYRTFEPEPPDYSYVVSLGDLDIQAGEFRERTMRVDSAALPMTKVLEAGEADLSFAKEGKGLLYYGAHLSYYPTARDLPPMDEGFKVERIVRPLDGGEAGSSFEAGTQLMVTLKVTSAKPRHFVVIEDPLPAGIEAMDSSLKTASTNAMEKARETLREDNPDAYPWYFVKSEIRDDRVVVFVDYLPPGTFTYVYVANAVHHGDFNLSPTRAEEMYTPETFGRSRSGRFEVR